MRCKQTWPPKVVKGDGWSSVYDAALATVQDKGSILSTVDEAVTWVNGLIAKIVCS